MSRRKAVPPCISWPLPTHWKKTLDLCLSWLERTSRWGSAEGLLHGHTLWVIWFLQVKKKKIEGEYMLCMRDKICIGENLLVLEDGDNCLLRSQWCYQVDIFFKGRTDDSMRKCSFWTLFQVKKTKDMQHLLPCKMVSITDHCFPPARSCSADGLRAAVSHHCHEFTALSLLFLSAPEV